MENKGINQAVIRGKMIKTNELNDLTLEQKLRASIRLIKIQKGKDLKCQLSLFSV